jgi:beta-glucanase (GH16 family)
MTNIYYKYKDMIFNFMLNVWCFILYNIFFIKQGKFKIPTTYKLVVTENFTTMSRDDLSNKYDLSPWPGYLPSNLQQWYDPKAVELNNGLALNVSNNTKTITSYTVNGAWIDNQSPVTINHGVGMVKSLKAYQYGIFEWNIELPFGPQLWPAIWLTGRDSWPPEIDILEGYSDDNMKYGRNLNSNIHCGSNPTNHYGIGANRHGLFVDLDKPLNLICHWTKDFIKIYYNGFLCRILTNPTDLKWFINSYMLVIMNNALRTDVAGDLTVSPLIVIDFKYYQSPV